MSNNPFLDYQQQFYKMYSENMSKFPGVEAYQQAFEKLMPGMENYWQSVSSAVTNPQEYMKNFYNMYNMVPGMENYWKTFSSMMPDPTSFMNMWPYKIPGMDVYTKVFDLWKGMSNPATFVQDFQEKYMDLMQDLFKGILPEGTASFMAKPMQLMDSCVTFYRQMLSPWMSIDEGILNRISQGDLTAYAEFFREFNKKYEETFDKFFNMMGMGLNREANEDMMKAINAYYKAMFAAGELMSIIMVTCAKSMNVLVQKYQSTVAEGKVITTFRDFYDLWYNVTEGELVKLLDTDEFSKAFSEFSDKYGQYMVAMNREYERMLAVLPIPTNKDMKSLYKTVYDLRKDVRDLKRAVEALQTGKKEEA